MPPHEITIAPPPATAAEPRGLQRFMFRWGVIYLGLHNVPGLAALLPGLHGGAERLGVTIKHGAAWVGREILGIVREIPVAPTGSSDTTADWIRVAVYLVMAAVIAAIWAATDRRPGRDATVKFWVRLGLRYVLGSAMLVYGFMKIIPPTQFPEPSFAQLTLPLGEASPQGLLWRFMGFSPVYVAFLGAGEAVAGALLLFRRTTLAGALLTAAIMANVVMLNLCYDVPVKLYSGHLLLMAMWLVWPDLPRLADMLLFNRPAGIAPVTVPWSSRWARRCALGAKLVFMASIGYQAIGGQFETRAGEAARFGASPPELRGIWQVEAFERDGRLIPPLATDNTRWHTLIFGDYRTVLMRRLDGKRGAFWFVQRGTETGRFTFELSGAKTAPTPVVIALPESGVMKLAANLDGADLKVSLRRVDENEFTLRKRGFHWITEFSFNR